MGRHRYKCPLCGAVPYSNSIDKSFDIETFENIGMGRARGVKLHKIFDLVLIDKIKNKIKFLYNQFFSVMKPIPLLSMHIFPLRSMDLVDSRKWEVIA